MKSITRSPWAIATALIAGAALLGGSTKANAGLVASYSTSGEFSASGPGYTISDGGSTIRFTGSPASQWTQISFTGVTRSTPEINSGSTLTSQSFGTFSVTRGGNGGGNVNITFELEITQTLPSRGTAEFPARVIGNIQGSNVLTLTFDSPLFESIAFNNYMIDGQLQSGTVTYTVPATRTLSNSAGQILNGTIGAVYSPSSTGPGPVVPEPGTMVLALSGLIPLGIAGLRRFRHREVAS